MSSISFIKWVIGNRSVKEIYDRVIDVAAGWCVRPFSFITPRSKNKWLIGNKTGWSDNSKYMCIYLKENNPEKLRIIWIAKSIVERDLVRSKGFEAYSKWSLKGLYHALTAKVFIFSSSVSDINYWAAGKAITVNLWHGVGLKKLGMKQSDVYNPNDIITRIVTPFFYSQPTYFVGPSEIMARHFAECYNLSAEQMLQVGYPRCDFLLSKQEKVKNLIMKYESPELNKFLKKLRSYSKVFIYMPTFRDDQHDFIKASGINFAILDEILKEKNYLFILKLHPATRVGNLDLNEYKNVISVDKRLDIYPVLRHTDVLITDYSSIYYDYILMREKDVILFPFDYNDYISNSRDLAFDYLENTLGPKAWSFDDLLHFIQNDNNKLESKEREVIIKKFWGDNYQCAHKKIKNTILNKVSGV